ncbi:MAG TPA: hypothetical protein VFE30_11395 [Anaeromyxobacteraceae bacterium]|nr:hypothetical protein [Anaeromyxobacteraceae bacterium]
MLDTTLWRTIPAANRPNPPPATAQLAPGEGSARLLRLSGQLALGWMGRLVAALAARRVGVISAHARQAAPRLWDADFELEPLDPAVDLAALDYLAFAALQPARPPCAVPRLRSYRLERTDEAVRVELTAADQLGFLDGILRAFAACGLFPREMLVETRGAEALDSFDLCGIGGRAPPQAICEALDARLARLIGSPAALTARPKTSR